MGETYTAAKHISPLTITYMPTHIETLTALCPTHLSICLLRRPLLTLNGFKLIAHLTNPISARFNNITTAISTRLRIMLHLRPKCWLCKRLYSLLPACVSHTLHVES